MRIVLLFSLVLGCRDPGAGLPLPDGAATWTFGEPSAFDPQDTGSCAAPLDADRDGWDAAWAGGSDCDDNDPDVHPLSADLPGDGIDGNCDGADAGRPTDCVVTGQEVCDGEDNDCDGRIDDPYLAAVSTNAVVATRGALLADGATALVVGIAGGEGTPDGRIEVYDIAGDLVVRIDGVDQSSSFGSQVATGRDLTGDGLVDLVVSAPYAIVAGVPNRGRVFVFPGPLAATTTLAQGQILFEGGENDGQAGGQLALLPDLDGDGLADIAIGDYRHALLLSGVPAPAVTTTYGVSRAWADLEWNTGGGAWNFAFVPDEDGDGLPELAAAVSTYNSSAGLVAVYHSATLVGHKASTDAAWSLEGALGDGLGASLTALDGALWAISAGAPARITPEGAAPLAIAASALQSAGDQDGDGREDLALTTTAGIAIAPPDATAPTALLQGAFTLQGARATLAPADEDGDGLPELTVVTADAAAVLSGAWLHFPACNADADLVTTGQGDCDDTRADVAPVFAAEVCNGIDDDCDGLTDEESSIPLGLRGIQATTVGDLDGDGTDELAVLLSGGTLSAIDGEDAPGGVAHVRFTLTGARDDIANVFAGAGDVDGNGFTELIVATTDDAWMVPTGEDGEVSALGSLRFRDGTRWRQTGGVGVVGDVDGDGLDDPWLLLRAPAGGYGIGVFSAPGAGTVDVDEASVLLSAPESWDLINVAATRPRAHAEPNGDIDGDGRDDLVLANPRSAFGDGRAYVFLGLTAGESAMDAVAQLQLYGDPNEALGRALAVGDHDGDGRADVALAGTGGARLLTGAACPLFGPRVAASATTLAFADLDGNGAEELYLAEPAATWWGAAGGVIWRVNGDEEPAPWRAGLPGEALATLLVGVGDVDDARGGDLVYSRSGILERAGGACQ